MVSTTSWVTSAASSTACAAAFAEGAFLATPPGAQMLPKPAFIDGMGMPCQGSIASFIMFWLVSTINRVCIAIILTTGE